MLAKLRTTASFARFSRTKRESAPSPPPPPTPEELAEYLAQVKLREELAAENAARELADRLRREEFERELADEAMAREMEEQERRREEDEAKATAEALRRIEVEMIEEELKRKNGLFECPICAEEYFRGEVLVACTEGHALCATCAREGSKAAFENLDVTLRCLADSDCEAHYHPDERVKFLDYQQLAQLDKIRMEKDLAGLAGDGLLQCPFCPYAALYEDADQLTEFDCLQPHCGKRSCIKCKHIAHPGVPCALANPSAVHKLEEQMSEALIRRCGKCRMPYTKVEGCNL
ncbi:hypothetical protein JCM10213_008673, partial [Rhodosporidiobolus nylandii]